MTVFAVSRQNIGTYNFDALKKAGRNKGVCVPGHLMGTPGSAHVVCLHNVDSCRLSGLTALAVSRTQQVHNQSRE